MSSTPRSQEIAPPKTAPQSKPPIKLVLWSAIALFFFSSLQHGLFRSSAWDLAIFDQATYLISQGLPPISSFLGFHILGDHAALIFYILALPYKLFADVHWLLAVQALALASGAFATWALSRQAGIHEHQATTIAIAYLLYPIVFNANMADFHPEVIAIPALLFAIWAARAKRLLWFCLCLGLTLICRDALALNLIAMGVWLILFEKRRSYGAIAILAATIWFIWATQILIPTISADAASLDRFLFRYSWLGNSYSEIAKNFFLKPNLVIAKLVSGNAIGYLLMLSAPLVWAMQPRQFAPLIGALPTIAMNLLSSNNGQRSLIGQYSVPILPFLMVVAISVVANQPKWFKRKWVITGSAIGFLILAKYGLFFTYLDTLDTWSATRTAISQIQTKGNVLTDHRIAPHLAHRQTIIPTDGFDPKTGNLDQFDFVLIDVRHPWLDLHERAIAVRDHVKSAPNWKLAFNQADVFLFTKRR